MTTGQGTTESGTGLMIEAIATRTREIVAVIDQEGETGTGTATETEIETEIEIATENETGTETENAIVKEIGTGTGVEIDRATVVIVGSMKADAIGSRVRRTIMFYSETILSKKGPLAKVWLAAHWERKLTKNQFLQTNIHNSVDAIVGTERVPMALRLSGQLLLGITRIYSRKTKYLLEDCNETLVKIKVFRSDSNNDSNLLLLDGNTDLDNSKASAAAFNAITIPEAMTEYDLLLPAQTIDIGAWGLNPKLNQHRDMTLEEEGANEENDLLSTIGNYQSLDHGRRHHFGLDIETGRNHMNRIGAGGGYSAMDFDLAGPDDALDLDMFGEDLVSAGDIDFLKRPHHQRDDLEIEIGRRDASTTRRSASVDPFGILPSGKSGPLRLAEGSEDGRAASVHGGSVHDQPAFDDFIPTLESTREALHFDLVEGEEGQSNQKQQQQQQQHQHQQQPASKKRKLVVDAETEMSQERGVNANGLLTTHEMLPRSRKMLRLQQIEQDVAHGGLAGFLLDCTAGPRVMGSALVPELASMFSRRLQIAPEVPPPTENVVQTNNVVPAAEAQLKEVDATWEQDQVESWMDQVQDNDPDFGVHQTTPPPADKFDGFQLDSPRKEGGEGHVETEEIINHGEEPLTDISQPVKRSLFQESDDSDTATTTSTKQLLGSVFSTSTIQAMRLVQQGLEALQIDSNEQQGHGVVPPLRTRSTRTSIVATASSAANKDNTTRVTFSKLMEGPPADNSEGPRRKGTRADAAKLFFELLVLSTKDAIKVKQEKSFGEIEVGGSPWLKTLVEADANTE
ncbi:sister chromatid cohesion protein 1, partial [Modicella reniformis]